jgi:hypothetical protein
MVTIGIQLLKRSGYRCQYYCLDSLHVPRHTGQADGNSPRLEVSRGEQVLETRRRPNSTRIRVLGQVFQKDPILFMIRNYKVRYLLLLLYVSSHSPKTTVSLTDQIVLFTNALARIACETRQIGSLSFTTFARPSKSSIPRISSSVSSRSLHHCMTLTLSVAAPLSCLVSELQPSSPIRGTTRSSSMATR